MKYGFLVSAILLLAADTSGRRGHAPWEINPGEGVGPIKRGMSEKEVIEIMGKPQEISAYEADTSSPACRYLNYQSKGMSIRIDDDRVTTIFLYSGLKGGSETGEYAPFPGRTRKGIGVTSTRDEVLKAYGRPDNRVQYGWLKYDEGLGFSFAAKSGTRMTHMCVSRPK